MIGLKSGSYGGLRGFFPFTSDCGAKLFQCSPRESDDLLGSASCYCLHSLTTQLELFMVTYGVLQAIARIENRIY